MLGNKLGDYIRDGNDLPEVWGSESQNKSTYLRNCLQVVFVRIDDGSVLGSDKETFII